MSDDFFYNLVESIFFGGKRKYAPSNPGDSTSPAKVGDQVRCISVHFDGYMSAAEIVTQREYVGRTGEVLHVRRNGSANVLMGTNANTGQEIVLSLSRSEFVIL